MVITDRDALPRVCECVYLRYTDLRIALGG